MLASTDRVWASDTIDAVERQRIQRWTTLLVPPEMTGAHLGGPVAHVSLPGRVLAAELAQAGQGLLVNPGRPSEMLLDAAALENIAIGFVCAFIMAILVVRWLLGYVSQHGYGLFAWWRIIVGSLALLALAAGM